MDRYEKKKKKKLLRKTIQNETKQKQITFFSGGQSSTLEVVKVKEIKTQKREKQNENKEKKKKEIKVNFLLFLPPSFQPSPSDCRLLWRSIRGNLQRRAHSFSCQKMTKFLWVPKLYDYRNLSQRFYF